MSQSERAPVTRESLIRDAEEIRVMALAKGDYRNAAAAEKNKARIAGHRSDNVPGNVASESAKAGRS